MLIGYGTSGTTHDFFVFNAAGDVWNGSTFVTWADGDYTSYRVTATETGSAGRFIGSEPTGAVYYDLRERGASLATSWVVWTDETATLQEIQNKTDLINSGTVNTTNTEQTRINITRNDAYDGTANPAFSFTVSKDYTSGWTGTLTIRHRVTNASLLSKSVTITDATTLTVSLDSTDTAFSALTTNADFGPHPYDLQMISSSSRQTAFQGIAMISRDETLT